MLNRLHNFFIKHDEIKIFTIIYVAVAIAVALFINLFAFLVWILIHYFVDVYKHRFDGFSMRFSILKSLQDCRLDFMFFFVGLGIDIILHYSIAAAAARGAPVLGRGMRVFGGIVRVIPRLAGTIKAAEGIAHVTADFLHHKTHKKNRHKKEEIRIQSLDYVAVIVSFLFMSLAFYISLINGSSVSDVIHVAVEALNPMHIQGFALFG